MLKICYNTCCGIDVHKKILVATIATTDERKVTTYKTKQFSTFTKDIKRLKQWLIDNNCKDVCMESTGKYWIPIFNILEDQFNIVIANPKYIKAVKLDCGSVSLDYDHKTTSDESADTIVPHIINALDFASNYLLNKLKRT